MTEEQTDTGILTRRMVVVGMAAAFAAMTMGEADAAAFKWDGAWKGQSGSRTTVITISKGKVVGWSSNGEMQPIKASKVAAGSVTITHLGGASVTMKPNPDGTVTYVWRGRGQTSTVVMKRQ